jgi:hypothetical protein
MARTVAERPGRAGARGAYHPASVSAEEGWVSRKVAFGVVLGLGVILFALAWVIGGLFDRRHHPNRAADTRRTEQAANDPVFALRPPGSVVNSPISKYRACTDNSVDYGWVGRDITRTASVQSTLDYYRERLARLGWGDVTALGASPPGNWNFGATKSISGHPAMLGINLTVPVGTKLDDTVAQVVHVQIDLPPVSSC